MVQTTFPKLYAAGKRDSRECGKCLGVVDIRNWKVKPARGNVSEGRSKDDGLYCVHFRRTCF